MSHTIVNDNDAVTTTNPDDAGMSLDGNLPRLASEPSAAAPPEDRHKLMDLVGTIAMPDDAPVLPLVSPVPTTPGIQAVPSGERAEDGTVSESTSPNTDPDGEPEHPMAHLMPTKSMPTEASRRAAEQRAIRKAKGKKIKIGVAAGALVFSAVVGPPLGKWFVNALNEAGSTQTEVEPGE